VTPLPVSEDVSLNFPRHQQACREDIFPEIACALCNQNHPTRECDQWPERAAQREILAMNNWVCTRCLDKEHGNCPAEQIICGINRCVRHHHPLFHNGPPHMETGNSWAELTQRHRDWTRRRDLEFRQMNLHPQHERTRTIEGYGDSLYLDRYYGRGQDRMPPFHATRDIQGRVVMSEETFRRLCAVYQSTGELADELASRSIREVLIRATDEERQILMAEELSIPRDDPQRLNPPVRRFHESDAEFLHRRVRHEVSLELYPFPDIPESENSDSSDNGDDPDEGGDDADQEPSVPRRRNIILSGNPHTEPDSSSAD